MQHARTRVAILAGVPAVHIVDIAVAVVVEAVGLLAITRLAPVDPRLSGELRVREVHAVVHDRHDHARAGDAGPRGGDVDIDVRLREIGPDVPAARVLQRPLVGERRFERGVAVQEDLSVHLRGRDSWIRAQGRERRLDGATRRSEHLAIDQAEALDELPGDGAPDAATVRGRRPLAVADDEPGRVAVAAGRVARAPRSATGSRTLDAGSAPATVAGATRASIRRRARVRRPCSQRRDVTVTAMFSCARRRLGGA